MGQQANGPSRYHPCDPVRRTGQHIDDQHRGDTDNKGDSMDAESSAHVSRIEVFHIVLS